MAHRPPPRTRPAVETLDADALARLERGSGDRAPSGAADPAAPAAQDPVRPEASPNAASGDDRKAWRERLAELVDAGSLTALQEADCFRLFEAQETHVRETMPRLLAELKPHFDTDGEAQAKLRFTDALQTMKRRQRDDLVRLLRSFGIDPAPATA